MADAEVAGYYTLVVGQVEYDGAPERLKKGLATHPVPIMLLARLAVASAWQGKGLGAGLLKDAMLRTLQAAEIAGIRAFAVQCLRMMRPGVFTNGSDWSLPRRIRKTLLNPPPLPPAPSTWRRGIRDSSARSPRA